MNHYCYGNTTVIQERKKKYRNKHAVQIEPLWKFYNVKFHEFNAHLWIGNFVLTQINNHVENIVFFLFPKTFIILIFFLTFQIF